LAGTRFQEFPQTFPGGGITAFMEDADQSLWIASFGNGVFRLRNGVLTAFSDKDGLPDNRVAGLYRDHSGRLWTAGWKGLSSWNGTRFVGDSAINAVVPYAISCVEDRSGNMWIASSSGLFRAQTGEVTKMDHGSGLSGDFVSDVLEDREGNIWVATRGGLDRLRDGPVRSFTQREGLIRDTGPIAAAGQGAIWTVSGERIARIGMNEIGAWRVGLPAGSTPPTLLPQSDSSFLIGFDRGVMRWSPQRAELLPELAGLNVRCILQARDGSIWIGTANRGLLRWNSPPGSRTLRDTGVKDKFLVALAEDHSGAIWAGNNVGGGLYRVTGEHVEHFGRSEGLRSPSVYTLFVDGKGDLWIGSTGGLSWFHEGKLLTVSSQQGLPSDQVFEILDDSYDRLWFTGYRGIAFIEKRSLAEWADGRRRQLTPTVYRSADGLQIYNVSPNFPNAVRSVDGHLWFANVDGVSEVTPPIPGASLENAFPILIEDVVIDGARHPTQEHIQIPAGARSIEVSYTALTLSSPETVRFRYRLEGTDNDWVDVNSRRTAFYNNLKPGTYKFRVAASAGEEQWREATALTLQQLPFFYQTAWFKLLVSAVVLSLGVFGYRLRVKQAVDRIQDGFRERMEERTRIAQELHDTVMQSITGSTMLVANAADGVPDSLPGVKGTLIRAADRLGFALAESRAALKGLRASTELEIDLVKQLSAVADDANNNETAFELAVAGEPREIRPMIRYEVFRIGSEAIGNAFRHSGATSIRVELTYENGLRLSVKDNGKGIQPAVLHGVSDCHFGLRGMRERAARIGAKLEVNSRVGEGTQVDLRVPQDIAFFTSRKNRSRLIRAVSRLRLPGRTQAQENTRVP
jgi:signal transduction histidine kinase/ligand-binding sensor domain-containing protein